MKETISLRDYANRQTLKNCRPVVRLGIVTQLLSLLVAVSLGASGLVTNFVFTTLFFILCEFWIWRRGLSPEYSHLLLFALGCVWTEATIYAACQGELPYITGYFQMLMIGSSIMLSRSGWVFSCNLLFLAAWLATKSVLSTLSLLDLGVIVATSIVSLACFLTKSRLLVNQYRLDSRQKNLREELREALLASQAVQSKKAEELEELAEEIAELKLRLKQETEEHGRAICNLEVATSLDRLAGGLAHEFNNSITSLWGSLDIALLAIQKSGGSFCPEAHEDLKEGLSRITELSSRLVNMSGSYPLEREAVTVETLLGRLKKTVSLSTEFFTDCPSAQVLVDPGAWLQICQNLISNGRDAAGKSGLVRLSVLQQDGKVLFRVDDDGPGISPEERELVLKPYYTTKNSSEGSGLGLAIAAALAEQHGADFSLGESPEGGLSVQLRIACTAKSVVKMAKPERDFTSLGGNETILVAEDDSRIRKVLKRYLVRMGYNVLLAKDGQDALAVVQSEEVDMVLSDLVMPRMNGTALVEELRSSYPELPILVMTGYSEEASSLSGHLNQTVPVVTKPFSLPQLESEIRTILTG